MHAPSTMEARRAEHHCEPERVSNKTLDSLGLARELIPLILEELHLRFHERISLKVVGTADDQPLLYNFSLIEDVFTSLVMTSVNAAASPRRMHIETCCEKQHFVMRYVDAPPTGFASTGCFAPNTHLPGWDVALIHRVFTARTWPRRVTGR